MTDNMDKLLFDIGEEANARVDFDGMYASLLAESTKVKAKRSRSIKYMGMAAACVIVLGVAAMMPGGLNKAEAEAAPAPAAYAAAETPAEAAPAAEEERVALPEADALDIATAYGCDALSIDNEYEESYLNGAVTEEAVEEEAVEESTPISDAGQGAGAVDECLINADTGVFEIGIPKDGFEEYLKEKYYGIIVIPFDRSGIPEGHADISVTLCENTAVWNTGSGVYYIEIKAVGSAEEFAEILRDACQ